MIEPRTPPHSNSAEQSLLGAAMLAGIGRISWIQDRDFYFSHHREIWRAITECDRRADTPDVVMVMDEMQRSGTADDLPGGASYLIQLANETPGPAALMSYARVVREHSQRRQLMDLSADVSDRAMRGESPAETIEHVQSQLLTWTDRSFTGPVKVQEAARAWLDRMHDLSDQSMRIDTGLADVDGIIKGLLPSEFVIIAGRPGMGKTSAALGAALHIAERHPVLFFSLEMSGEQLVKRMVTGGVSGDKLRDPSRMNREDWGRVTDGLKSLKRYQLHVDDTGGLNIYQLAARARALHRSQKIRAIFIDYLQLITCRANSRYDEISEISRQLKRLAKDLDIPVIALSQLNRGVETRPDKRPRLADLRESGQLEQDADVIVFLYRHAYYTDGNDSPIAEWIVAKHRDAEPGTAYVLWRPKLQKFLNAAESDITEYKADMLEERAPGRPGHFQRMMRKN